MDIPEEMTCNCREPEITETDVRFAEKFGLDPVAVHRFNDEWLKVAAEVVRERRGKVEENGSTSGGNQG